MTPGSVDLKPGETFAGRYRVVQLIGMGGTSAVYKVQDQLVGETIALKIIKPGAAKDAQLLANFKRELALARKISHKNVVRIYDIGEDAATKLPFIVMEYVEGRTLASMLSERGKLTLTDFLPIFRQMCEALACVHGHNVLHRDVKPANLMFGRDGVLKLMDFGIARSIEGDQTLGPAIGTPAYMSPEQLMKRTLSPSTDVFSIGAMSCELLTGRQPFAGMNLADRCTGKPPQLRKEAPHVPAALAKAIEKCLEPDAANRFQSVKELLEATADALVPPAEPGKAASLADVMPADPPDPKEALPLFLQVLYRVTKVHEAGQSHVELCPRNLKIKEDGEVDLDVIRGTAVGGTLVIREPRYSSPDAFMEKPGTGKEAQIAADIYSLGMIFYEILLGKKLYEQQFASITAEQNDFAWLRWHGDASLKARPVQELVPTCPAQLSDIVAKMMEKRPDQRVKALSDVVSVLQAVDNRLEDTQKVEVEAKQEPAKKEEKSGAHEIPRSNVGKYVGIAAVILLAAGGGWWWMNQPKDSPENEPAPEVPKTKPADPKPVPANLPAQVDSPTGAMILIPDGEFTMGRNPDSNDPAQPNEKPASTVKLGAYYIDRIEVTVEAYAKFSQATGRKMPSPPPFDARYMEKKDHPIMNVSWSDAAAFAKWAGKRLPREEEWEKAARGTDGRRYPWGAAYSQGTANLKEGGAQGPAAAGWYAFDFSPYGALDMAGNVPEWVDADGGNGKKIVRGGGFQSTGNQATTTYRTPVPGELDPSAYTAIGFRCAASPEAALKLRGQ